MRRAAILGLVAGVLGACSAPVRSPETQDGAAEIAPVVERVAEPTAYQTETFGALTRFVGNTYRGEPGGGGLEPVVDIQSWEWALGGAAILIRHALATGEYGGDTYVYKDAASGALVYVYITNAGFRTQGVITVNADGSYTAEEAVEGHATITKVRSTTRLNADGSTAMQSEYLDGGTWVPGHAFTYAQTREPVPALKTPVLRPEPAAAGE